ncbi:response regulator transcription factor [Galbibacter mesophilus]|uniref:response regulator transcription factor n=1 Tax=Galbibacter mesophilus TaxID=379069 RepID=UPI00191F80D6|nr:response regulator transcription factor [Galbibacter mesophilus]MCM5661911.1 response regulator transcription factor [Galbibacter mesophilus]
MKKILLVEDDTSLGYLLTEYLKMKQFQMVWAQNGEEALSVLEKEDFNLIVMDVMMPKMDGFTLAEKVRDLYPAMPFIFLSARSLKIDVLKGFALGAVDYLKKPIDEEELVVRIEALLSRLNPPEKNENQSTNAIKIGLYTFDPQLQKLISYDEETTLTSRESELLLYLYNRKNILASHKEILTSIWGESNYFNRKSLNVFVSHLRKYLSKDPHISIDNIHNKGFLFKIEE